MSYHSSLAQPFNGSESEEGNLASGSCGANYFQFSGADWSSAQARICANLPEKPDFEIVDGSQQNKYEYAQDDLKNAESTAARLTALEKIAASGTDSFAFQDKDGVERQFRVETNKCGDKTLIHCYGKDSEGNEQLVMRVARNASGELEPEKSRDGKPVSYYGDNWSHTMQGKSVLVAESRNEHCHDHQPAAQAGQPPHRSQSMHRRDDCDHNKSDRRSFSKHERDRERERDRESERDRERECDREQAAKQDRDRDCDRDLDRDRDRDRDRDPHYRDGESCRPLDKNPGLRLDIGRTLADLAMLAAPFLMAQMNNSNRCHEYYPYRHYPGNLPERGCRNYYDGNGANYRSNYGANYGYQNFRNQPRGFCR